MRPHRTIRGKIAKHLFVSVPTIWVEGELDLIGYEALAARYDLRLECAGGREECIKLAREMALHEYPYAVIIDGDYEVLIRSRSFHRRAIVLRRHSIENYLCEERVIAGVVRRLAGITGKGDPLSGEFESFVEHLEEELRGLVKVDVALELLGDGGGPFPSHISAILRDREGYRINVARVRELRREGERRASASVLARAEALLDEWEGEGRRFIDLVRGHVVFGGLTRLVAIRIVAHRGRAPRIANSVMLALLSQVCWEECPAQDHRSVRRRVRAAASEIRRLAPWVGEN